jgi:hypothetical protein
LPESNVREVSSESATPLACSFHKLFNTVFTSFCINKEYPMISQLHAEAVPAVGDRFRQPSRIARLRCELLSFFRREPCGDVAETDPFRDHPELLFASDREIEALTRRQPSVSDNKYLIWRLATLRF